MIRIIDFRCLIEQHDTHEVYYPKVIGFNCVDDFPLNSAPSATITIQPNANQYNVEAVTHVGFDDIIQLQVAIRYSLIDKNVWFTIFHGRVQNQSKKFGTSNEIELTCVGHIQEAFDALMLEDKTYPAGDAADILKDLCNNKLTRIKYDANFVEIGVRLSAYNMQAQQNYVSDAFKEMEKVCGNSWKIGIEPFYYDTGVLDTCYLTWDQLSEDPTPQYAAIAGTPRLISATFNVMGEDVKTVRYVRGDTVNDVQYSGSATDSQAVALYGARYQVDTYTWIESNALCTTLAVGLVNDSKYPYISGQVELEGTPDAKVGDLVIVKIPQLDVNENEIDGVYTATKVTQSYSNGQYKTLIDLNKNMKNEYSYISQQLTKVLNVCYKNQARG